MSSQPSCYALESNQASRVYETPSNIQSAASYIF
nr:MAG TPA: hypothetical protein [Caudoviricetes sp.]